MSYEEAKRESYEAGYEEAMTQEAAEALAQRHVDFAQKIVGWFGFDRRKEITWGSDYNQCARDLYVEACKLVGAEPHPIDPQ